MSLRALDLLETYRSDDCDLVKDFYEPCLQRSLTYDRAVGFFSSSALALVARGLTAFIQAGGRMRLVTSPQLSEEDVTAIAQGLEQRDAVIQRALLRSFEKEVLPDLAQQRLAALTWLLAQGRLRIKLAVPQSLQGLYHEKLGIFADAEGNLVTFSGSANESETAFQHNFEVLEIFTSWQVGVEQRTLRRVQAFEDLWQNRTAKVEVMPFPEAVQRSLIQKYGPDTPPMREPSADRPSPPEPRVADNHGDYSLELPATSPSGVPIQPDGITLRDYQQQAIANWFANNGRGTLKMATGSGKTITALAIAAALYAKIELQALIVVCPYRHLVNQWARECEKFGLLPILAFDTVQSWQSELSRQLYGLRSDRPPFLTVITTNATLTGAAFQSQLPYFPEKTLIIGDEAHNLGSPKLAASLPRTIGLRLALSATPERYFDDLGTQALLDYFGPVLQPEFTLADALRAGALVRYRYYPLLVELTESEAQRYSELTTKIGQALSIDEDEGNAALSALSMRRAKLIANAAHKLTALRSLMQSRLHTSHTLFYCGDGSVEDAVSAETTRHLDAVTYLLGKELGYRVNTYTAATALDQRETLRQQFESGELQGLVAIRCLDEGVDIPATRTAVILASSNNPRQFIQRRGRVLRPAPGKARAEIFDMIVLPPDLERKTLDAERSLLRKELQRFLEFADLADNAGAARVQLLDLQKRYQLMDM